LEVWTRTCPAEQEPGRFTTSKGWLDPFRLLSAEDPDNRYIASVLSQSAIHANFSGAAIADSEGRSFIEGALGEGDRFMMGQRGPEVLPDRIVGDVARTYKGIATSLGAIRFEWVHDGETVWIVQLHLGGTKSSTSIIVPGEASEWVVFEDYRGLQELRRFLESLPSGVGVQINGEIGLTSHMADLPRKAKRPARIEVTNHQAT
jgi:hypothetical protein